MATEICATPVVPMSFAPNSYGYGYGDNYRNTDSCLESLITSNQLNNGHANINSNISNAAQSLLSEINNDFGMTQAAISGAVTHLAAGQAQIVDAVRQEGRGISKEICDVRDTVRQEGRLTEQGFARTNENINAESRALLLKLCEQDKDMIRGFGEVKLDACKNTAELARQIAECCRETSDKLCEIQAVIVKGNADAEISRLKDQLLDAKLEAVCGRGNH
jgi:hypothetical protein